MGAGEHKSWRRVEAPSRGTGLLPARPVPLVTSCHGHPGCSVPDCLMWNHVGMVIQNLLSKSAEIEVGTATITARFIPGHWEKVMDPQLSAGAGCPGSGYTCRA